MSSVQTQRMQKKRKTQCVAIRVLTMSLAPSLKPDSHCLPFAFCADTAC